MVVVIAGASGKGVSRFHACLRPMATSLMPPISRASLRFGRSRLYRHKMRNGATRLAEGIVVAYKCDLLVAIVDGDMTDPDKRKMAHRFLESNTVQVWPRWPSL